MMNNWNVEFTKRAHEDLEKLSRKGLRDKVNKLAKIVRDNPFQTPPPFKKLRGAYSHLYSRRINIQHRFVYKIDSDTKQVNIMSMWDHY